MLSPAKYQEVLAFAHEISETVGCGSLVHEHRLEKSDVSSVSVEFRTRGLKIGYVFGDAELEYCRLPIAEYIAGALKNELAALKIQCDSNRRGVVS